MNNIKVSIIIPVYNGVEFLRRSFDSCVYQTLPEIEVIAVNDCSPNARDAEIMREYERIFPEKFRALFHEVNKRQGGARNTGIRAARGEYFLCVDQDDYLNLDTCEKMYSKAKSENADLCMCGYNLFVHGTITYNPPILYGVDSLETHNPTVWKLLTRKGFVIENNVFFPENVVTDDVVSILWFALTDKYCTMKEPFYNWMRHEGAECYYLPYRFAESCPTSFIMIRDYCAFQNLAPEMKTWFNIMLTCHLYNSILVCINRHRNKLVGYCRLTLEALNRYSPEFVHPVYSQNARGKAISLTLKYIKDHIEEADFAAGFVKFHNKLKSELEFRKLSYVISEKKLKRDKFITLWGAGIRGKRLAEYLAKANVSFEITDINPDLYGEEVCGVTVKPWSELKDKTDLVIVTPLRVFESVKRMIDDANIEIVNYKKLLN